MIRNEAEDKLVSDNLDRVRENIKTITSAPWRMFRNQRLINENRRLLRQNRRILS